MNLIIGAYVSDLKDSVKISEWAQQITGQVTFEAIQGGHRIARVRSADKMACLNKRLSGPRVTECLIMSGTEQEQIFPVAIRSVNEHILPERSNPRLVNFSKREFALHSATELRMGTPEYYRKYEGSQEGIRDPSEGVQQVDMASYLRQRMSPDLKPVSLEAITSLSSPSEPWLFCASIYPDSEANLEALCREFISPGSNENIAYDAATEIVDAEAFACQLGIDYVARFGGDDYMQPAVITHAENAIQEAFPDAGVQVIYPKALAVYHGPVMYEDTPIPEYSPAAVSDNNDFEDGYRKLYFSKRRAYSTQMEYRFAISMLWEPAKEKEVCYLPISDELRELTMRRI